jgi:hypothetical protein
LAHDLGPRNGESACLSKPLKIGDFVAPARSKCPAKVLGIKHPETLANSAAPAILGGGRRQFYRSTRLPASKPLVSMGGLSSGVVAATDNKQKGSQL